MSIGHAIVMEIAAPNHAAARRLVASSVSLHVEFAKALHARIALMTA